MCKQRADKTSSSAAQPSSNLVLLASRRNHAKRSGYRGGRQRCVECNKNSRALPKGETWKCAGYYNIGWVYAQYNGRWIGRTLGSFFAGRHMRAESAVGAGTRNCYIYFIYIFKFLPANGRRTRICFWSRSGWVRMPGRRVFACCPA